MRNPWGNWGNFREEVMSEVDFQGSVRILTWRKLWKGQLGMVL